MSPEDRSEPATPVMLSSGKVDAEAAPGPKERAGLDKLKAQAAKAKAVMGGAESPVTPKPETARAEAGKPANASKAAEKLVSEKLAAEKLAAEKLADEMLADEMLALEKAVAAKLAAALKGYKPLPATPDEMVDATGELRPLWRDFATAFAGLTADDIGRRTARAEQYLRDSGVFYRQYGGGTSVERSWP